MGAKLLGMRASVHHNHKIFILEWVSFSSMSDLFIGLTCVARLATKSPERTSTCLHVKSNQGGKLALDASDVDLVYPQICAIFGKTHTKEAQPLQETS
jgi:hypothetical protein